MKRLLSPMSDAVRTTRSSLCLLAFASITTACAEADSAARWDGSMRDSAGIRIVENPADGIWDADDVWRVSEAMTIGSDTMDLPDMSNSRLNWMTPTGEFLRSIPLSYDNGFPVRWDDDGTGEIVVQRRAMGGNENAELAAGEPLVRIARDGREQNLVLLPLARTVRMEGPRPVFTYFETEPSWDLGPSGTLRTAMTQEYRIEERNRDGTLRSIVSKETQRHAVTPEDREHIARQPAAGCATGGVCRMPTHGSLGDQPMEQILVRQTRA